MGKIAFGPDKMERFLAALRDAHPDMERLFLRGQCYALWRVVRTVFPGAQCFYTYGGDICGHVYIRHQGRLYDIRGRHVREPDGLTLLDHRRGDPPHRWGGRDRRVLFDRSNVATHPADAEGRDG